MEIYVVADICSDGSPCVVAAYTEKWRADLNAIKTGFFVIETRLLSGDSDLGGDAS